MLIFVSLILSHLRLFLSRKLESGLIHVCDCTLQWALTILSAPIYTCTHFLTLYIHHPQSHSLFCWICDLILSSPLVAFLHPAVGPQASDSLLVLFRHTHGTVSSSILQHRCSPFGLFCLVGDLQRFHGIYQNLTGSVYVAIDEHSELLSVPFWVALPMDDPHLLDERTLTSLSSTCRDCNIDWFPSTCIQRDITAWCKILWFLQIVWQPWK